jgi:hypothetical protein
MIESSDLCILLFVFPAVCACRLTYSEVTVLVEVFQFSSYLVFGLFSECRICLP